MEQTENTISSNMDNQSCYLIVGKGVKAVLMWSYPGESIKAYILTHTAGQLFSGLKAFVCHHLEFSQCHRLAKDLMTSQYHRNAPMYPILILNIVE